MVGCVQMIGWEGVKSFEWGVNGTHFCSARAHMAVAFTWCIATE
jgi:hypothetical protein